ncbi:MAG: hypothetical protein LBU58_10440, partial [Clostridiales bacterium]|nr:hypothetical protein [Clostridiales bacterium]
MRATIDTAGAGAETDDSRRSWFAVGSLAGILLVIATFFSTLISKDPEKAAPFFTDLMVSPAYVKNGFEPAYASLTDPDATDWDWKLPARHGRSLTAVGLSGSGLSEFLSLAARRIEDFTILIPFDLEADEIDLLYGDNPLSPGMYLSGIGENWEIYLNGEVLAKQLHLSPEGRITSFRSQRGVSIPFNRNFLIDGRNSLVFHIIGARSSSFTGLFYTGPYYIGDFKTISSTGEGYLTVALCTVYLFLGLYHILLYFLRKMDDYNLLYGIFSNLVAMYFFARSAVFYHVFEDTQITQRAEFAALYLVVFTLAMFLESLNFGKIKPITIVYGLSCAALIVLQCIAPIWFAEDLLMVWHGYGLIFLI